MLVLLMCDVCICLYCFGEMCVYCIIWYCFYVIRRRNISIWRVA